MTTAPGMAPGRDFAALGLGIPPTAGPAPDPGARIAGLSVDSRQVAPGWLFVAIPGTRVDGARFIAEAVERGAAAVIATEAGLALAREMMGEIKVPVFTVPDPRAMLAHLAAAWHGTQPEVVVAVTGTNGKTSVVHFVRHIWRAAGLRAASIGTTGVEAEVLAEPLAHTTPDPLALHGALARLAAAGVSHAALEASSHGLEQHRLDGVQLRAAGLTNVTRDHLDYHADHESYVAAKLRLFAELLPPGGVAVLNVDDAVFPRAAALCAGRGLRTIRVGRRAEADLAILGTELLPDGQRIRLRWDGVEHEARVNLVGAFQAENVALAAALAIAAGLAPGRVFAALPGLKGVRGRMEQVARRANGAAVYVDYAHTPDALATAIAALRPHCRGRLVVVFGAGGDRDAGKRPLMGEVVARAADVAIITDDNPRGEDPAAIRAAIRARCPGAHEIGDRGAAILAGVDMLKDRGDCLLIAGKGHEQGQIVGGQVIPFDDAERARSSVAALDGAEQRMGAGR